MNRKRTTSGSAGALLAVGVFGLTSGLVPVLSSSSAAWAKEDGGHEDGGHEDGGGKGNGDHGEAGHGEGGHGEPEATVAIAYTTSVDDIDRQDAGPSGAPGVETYLRIELGAARPDAGDASWLPPGPSDPKVFFDLDLDSTAMAGIAIGRSFGDGWRGEAAINVFGSSDFSGDWSYTVPATSGPHASMQGSLRSVAFFANGYYDFAMEGNFTPFLTAGLGLSRNTMGDWTRINPSSDSVTRSFGGASDSGFAWNVGAGVAWDVGPLFGSAPAKLELAWRYYDLGSVTGSTNPLPGNGSGGTPIEALNFDVTDQVFSVGLRFPI